jgi:hypothetical protein
MITHFFLEKSFAHLDFFMRFGDLLKRFRFYLLIIIAPDVKTLILVGNFY